MGEEMTTRPEATEHDPYYSTYIDRVPDGEILELLTSGLEETLALLAGCPEDRETFRYAPGKWSVREVVGHIVDTERLFAFRALQFARADPGPLPGVDQLVWAAGSNAGVRPLASLADEFARVRAATLSLFASFDEAAWARTGVASDCPVSVRALAWILAGHEIHHRRVLAERYLLGAD